MNQDRLCGLRASIVGHILPTCIVALFLVFISGCPSKTPHDNNQPPATSSLPPTTINQQPTTKNEQRTTNNQQPATITYRYKIVRTYPHDPKAFTQGLDYEDGILYESTGLYGQSALIKRDLETGEVLKMERLPRRYFGEGITVFGDRVIQLTWKSQTGFVYDKSTFRLLKEFTYHGEGWGLTHDGRQLIMSDGTATLRFLDPNTFAETRRITVRDEGRPLYDLNELEFIPDETKPSSQLTVPSPQFPANSQPTTDNRQLARGSHGSIFANIWQSDSIVVIDPETGRVTGWLDLSTLYPRPYGSDAVLNGIAFLPQSRHLLLTGKCWPRLYEIALVPEPASEQDR
jgi:glutaminyl-peptide cyclotransferase